MAVGSSVDHDTDTGVLFQPAGFDDGVIVAVTEGGVVSEGCCHRNQKGPFAPNTTVVPSPEMKPD